MANVIYNDDVERMVNPHSKRNQRKVHNRIRRKLTAMAVLLAVALAALMVWCCTNVPAVVTVGISAMCVAVSAFMGGQLWEVAR